MEDRVVDALQAAREAHMAATEALARAEAAARDAGVEVDGTAVPELRAERLRIVEPDGTTRMIIGNSTTNFAPIRGRDVKHPGRGNVGGIIFCNEEGTEAGGLSSAGGTVDGVPRQLGFWTVDDFEQNEGFRLGAAQEGEQRTKWIEFADQPYFSVADFLEEAESKTEPEREAIAQRYWPDGASANGIPRMRLSREADGTVALSMRDGGGTERIRLAVTAAGSAMITTTADDGTINSLIPS